MEPSQVEASRSLAKTSESSQAPSLVPVEVALQAAWVPYRVALLAARASAWVYAEGLLALHSEAAACLWSGRGPTEGFPEVAEGPPALHVALQAAQQSRSLAVAEGPPALQMAPPSQVEARRPVEPSQVVAVASRSLAVEPSQVEASHVSEAAHRIQYLLNATMHRFQRLLLHALMMESWAHHQAAQNCQAAVPTC